MEAEVEADRSIVERIAEAAMAGDHTIAVAESLTGGELAARFATGPDAAAWFAGGVVAYTPEVKQRVLGVLPGPVVTADTAQAMAAGVSDLFGADVTVAVTGVGGPDPDEGKPAGTVWWAVRCGDRVEVDRALFEGEPPDVVEATIDLALAQVLRALDGARGGARGGTLDGR